MTCTSCGAATLPGSGSFCSHCGRRIGPMVRAPLPAAMVVVEGDSGLSTLPELVPSASGVAVGPIDPSAHAGPPLGYPARFALARQDPRYASALTAEVVGPRVGLPLAVPVVMLVVGMVVLGQLTSGPAAGYGSLFMLSWLGLIGWFIWRAWRRIVAPTRAQLACVTKRVTRFRHVSADDHASGRAIFAQRVVLELEAGRRLGLGGDDAVLDSIVEGDLGVAYVKADRLIGFRRLAG